MTASSRNRSLSGILSGLGWLDRQVPASKATGARKVSRLNLAVERMIGCVEQRLPPNSARGERGGTSGGERKESRSASSKAKADILAAERLVRTLEETVEDLSRLVEGYLVETSEPVCRSCGRMEGRGANRIGGHSSPIYLKSKGKQLCRFCYEFHRETGELPPVLACHLWHTQGPRAAGVELAKRQREAV